MSKILEKIEENRKTKILVLKDPLHGCPTEFAEDYDKLFWTLVSEANKAGLSEKEIFDASQKGTKAGETELAGVMEARRRN